MKDRRTKGDKKGKLGNRHKGENKRNYSTLLFGFFKVSAFVSLIGGIGVLAYIFFGYLYTSPYFQVQEVVVNGEKRLSEIEVLNLARIDIGSNMLAVGLKDISERIERHPWIEHAMVKRRLPQRIIIDIIERTPAVMINFDRLYLVDKKGVVFKEVGPEDFFDVPVLTGLESKDLASNESVSKRLIEKALSILDEVNKRKVLGVNEISEINMDPRAGLTLFTVEDATQIRLGFGNYVEKLDNLKRVIADLQGRCEKAEYINLTYGRKIYVKLDRTDSPQTLVALRGGGGEDCGQETQ